MQKMESTSFTFISRNTSRPLKRNDPEENNTLPFEEEMSPVGVAVAITIAAKKTGSIYYMINAKGKNMLIQLIERQMPRHRFRKKIWMFAYQNWKLRNNAQIK